MNIRTLFSAAIMMAASSSLFADDAPASLLKKAGGSDDVFIISYKGGKVTYKNSLSDLNRPTIEVSKLDGVYFHEPTAFTQAMKYYKQADFKKAKKAFIKCEDAFKSVRAAKGNYSTLAGFYKLECSRRMFDLEALNKEQSDFIHKQLIRESHIEQLELNSLWEAVRLKDWPRLLRLTDTWGERDVSNSQLSQIKYCRALALEASLDKKPADLDVIIELYNQVMVLDQNQSSELVVKAAKNLLNIYLKDSSVKTAIKLWGKQDENKSSDGYSKLLAANAVARFYQLVGLDTIKPLSREHTALLKYVEKEKGK